MADESERSLALEKAARAEARRLKHEARMQNDTADETVQTGHMRGGVLLLLDADVDQ